VRLFEPHRFFIPTGRKKNGPHLTPALSPPFEGAEREKGSPRSVSVVQCGVAEGQRTECSGPARAGGRRSAASLPESGGLLRRRENSWPRSGLRVEGWPGIIRKWALRFTCCGWGTIRAPKPVERSTSNVQLEVSLACAVMKCATRVASTARDQCPPCLNSDPTMKPSATGKNCFRFPAVTPEPR